MSKADLCVYCVDDDVLELGPLADAIQRAGVLRCEVLHPADVAVEHLRDGNLVLVDLSLDDWPMRDGQDQVALKPANGTALVAVLREQARLLEAPPTGFALMTGKPGDIGHIVAGRRPHVVSRLSNLEWFFEKALKSVEEVEATATKVYSLAAAIEGLPKDFREIRPVSKLVEFLGVSHGDRLFDRYCDAVQRCRPPIHHLSQWSHGLSVVRWLLHRILPHTAFLFDRLDLALRLRVKPAWLKDEIDRNSKLATSLQRLRYTGPLSEFDGARWWRDAVEQWLWDETKENSANTTAVHELVTSLCTTSVEPIELQHPVIPLTVDLKRDSAFAQFVDVRRLQLDDWPDYADQPYIRESDVDANPDLASYVVE